MYNTDNLKNGKKSGNANRDKKGEDNSKGSNNNNDSQESEGNFSFGSGFSEGQKGITPPSKK